MAKNEIDIIIKVKDFATGIIKKVSRQFKTLGTNLVKIPFKAITKGFVRVANITL